VNIVSRLILIAYFLEAGLLLSVAPWSVFWDRNYLLTLWPALAGVAGSGYVRGAVSGLGLVNLAAAVAELAALFRPQAPHAAAGPGSGGAV